MVLAFYTLPTVFSACLYGRRHATLTALASVLLVVLLGRANPLMFTDTSGVSALASEWLDVTVWGGTLIVTAYLMGTLYEHKDRQLRELRETCHGTLLILRHLISKDKYTENHWQRVSVYATKIAASLELDSELIEDVRAAALLHDSGKLDMSRSILYKAARLTQEEFEEIQKHVNKGISMLEPVGGSLRRMLPVILAHHDKFDGSGYNAKTGTHYHGGGRVRLAHQRSAVPEGDVPVRGQRDPRERCRYGIRPDGRRGLFSSVSERRNGNAGTGGLTLPRLTS